MLILGMLKLLTNKSFFLKIGIKLEAKLIKLAIQ